MTTLILVPGFWLDASSWNDVTPALEAAGHDVRPLTLPGLESRDADRIVASAWPTTWLRSSRLIDAADEPVVLVGHSGGGAVVHGAVDRRPDRVTRAVYVDSGPLPDGVAINPALPVEAGEVPLPEWDLFRRTAPATSMTSPTSSWRPSAARAIPIPVGAARDPQVLTDERRYDVPITLISTTFTRDEIDGAIAAGVPYFSELVRRPRDVTIVELPTSHWPQFTKPAELAQAILDAVAD